MIGITADLPVRDTPLTTFSAFSANTRRFGGISDDRDQRTISLMWKCISNQKVTCSVDDNSNNDRVPHQVPSFSALRINGRTDSGNDKAGACERATTSAEAGARNNRRAL